jgi:trans-AT polyketide synthase/acyltransferase/oxidoreductase domain-containing protein
METLQGLPDPVDRLAANLGSAAFREDYGIKYAYLAGGMYRGIASSELVIALGKAGLMGFLGTAGYNLDQIASDIDRIQNALTDAQAYGVNLVCNLTDPATELETLKLYVQKGIKRLEASAFMQMTPALVWYRLRGLRRAVDRTIICDHKILGKISRPEVATAFMSPAPEQVVSRLLAERRVTADQAEMSRQVPMSDDVCVEADSGGHTDQGVAMVLFPTIKRLSQVLLRQHRFEKAPRIGLAGGIGTPEAALAAFIMGADFILTGSINQCTAEAGISDAVKDMLQDINVQDTDYAPAGDMFELGARVQVLKKGVFFPTRANRLFMLYTHYNALEEIPEGIQRQLQDKYFKKTFAEIWRETESYFASKGQQAVIDKANRSPKQKMALIFRWYFAHTARLAFAGDEADKVDYQVHTGPALGAFNQWVKGTDLENWRARHVDKIAEKLMRETAVLLSQRLRELSHMGRH